MKINSLKNYILGNSIGKKEYLFIKEFCLENEIEIIDFFKQGDKYNISAIYAFFIQSFSKSINDEKMIKYFLGKEKYLNNINFKSILENYDVLTTYQHLLGLNKDEELDLFIKEYKTEKILKFLKENPEYKESIKIKSLILNDVVSIEKFEKSEVFFNKDSYNKIDISPDRILGQKEKKYKLYKSR